ncbi:MAG TPA: hypothetical protein VFB13_19420 [Reyranella sp.]|nr:hypothetical protein [Reyranella sp.]
MVDSPNMRQEVATGCRWLSPATYALNKAHPEPMFELPYLQADSRLREAQALGGRREAARLDDQRKCLKLVEVESAHCQSSAYAKDDEDQFSLEFWSMQAPGRI